MPAESVVCSSLGLAVVDPLTCPSWFVVRAKFLVFNGSYCYRPWLGNCYVN